MRSPSISVIIASRDDHAYLWRCVDTLLSSPCDDVEFVLVDDGSAVDPFEFLLLPRYRQGPPIRSHRLVKRAGPGVARQKGAELADGERLVFVDARTSIPDGYIAFCARQLAHDPNTVITPATSEVDRKSWRPENSRRYQLLFDERLDFHWIRIQGDLLDAIPMTSLASTGISRDLYEACGGWGRHESNYLDHLWLSASVYAAGGSIRMMHDACIGYYARDRFRPKSERSEMRIEFCRTVFGSPSAEELASRLRNPESRRLGVTGPGDFATGGRLEYAAYLREAAARSDAARQSRQTECVSETEDATLPQVEERLVGFRDTTVRLRTNSTRLLAQFDRRYALLRKKEGLYPGTQLAVARDEAQYRLTGPYGSAAGDYKAVKTLVKEQLVTYLCEENSDLLWFHAGAVSTGSASILFVGPFGCGKSSLIVEMCKLNYRYLSDDVVPVDPNTGEAHPFPISPFFRSGARNGLESEDVLRLSVVSPTLNEGIVEHAPLAIKAVVFPRYHHEGGQEIALTSSAGGLLEMLQRCFNLPRGGSVVSALLAALAKIPFATVTFGNAFAAASDLASWEKKL